MRAGGVATRTESRSRAEQWQREGRLGTELGMSVEEWHSHCPEWVVWVVGVAGEGSGWVCPDGLKRQGRRQENLKMRNQYVTHNPCFMKGMFSQPPKVVKKSDITGGATPIALHSSPLMPNPLLSHLRRPHITTVSMRKATMKKG